MNKNNEIYAKKKQKELLTSTVTLQQSIELLKSRKEFVSK